LERWGSAEHSLENMVLDNPMHKTKFWNFLMSSDTRCWISGLLQYCACANVLYTTLCLSIKSCLNMSKDLNLRIF